MKRFLILLALVFAFPAEAGGPTDKDRVLGVIDQFFKGLKERDVSLWEAIMVPEGTVMVSDERAGEWSFRSRTIRSDLERLEADEAVVDERYFEPTVLIHETIAVVWTPYDLYVDGEFSHCGIDVFQLLKIEERWKIAQVAYTTEPDGCEGLGIAERE